MTRPVFVIGDVHGNVERLEALLTKADVDNIDCTVVQLGDLAHAGRETKSQDLEAWHRAKEGWIDIVLWGNHDRAIVDRAHIFGGFDAPDPALQHILKLMEHDGRLLMAYAAHDWLITHAGLHPDFVHGEQQDAEGLASWLNDGPPQRRAVINGVSRYRGGRGAMGGILWRDVEEELYDKVPQVFGHSASSFHIVRGDADHWHCIDIGGRGGASDPDAECLAGIWLPSQEIVRVDMQQER